MRAPTPADVLAARERLRGVAHVTPVLTSRTLDGLAGLQLFLKCENLQRVGAFKARGAANAVACLAADRLASGVCTHSSGNHAQALALAARERGVPAWIVMPTTAPAVKRRAVEGYGGVVVPCEPTLAAREATAARVVAETGATLIPPYDHPDVIAGQGTVGLELWDQVPALDAVVAPVGGGGLVSGLCLALRGRAAVYAAEPAGADDAWRSRRAGELLPQLDPRTVADGLRTGLGRLTWPFVRDEVAEVLRVDDAAIVAAMRLLWERTKLVVEPSGAVALAAILAGGLADRGHRRVGVVLSGGNVDLDALPWGQPSPSAGK